MSIDVNKDIQKAKHDAKKKPIKHPKPIIPEPKKQ